MSSFVTVFVLVFSVHKPTVRLWLSEVIEVNPIKNGLVLLRAKNFHLVGRMRGLVLREGGIRG